MFPRLMQASRPALEQHPPFPAFVFRTRTGPLFSPWETALLVPFFIRTAPPLKVDRLSEMVSNRLKPIVLAALALVVRLATPPSFTERLPLLTETLEALLVAEVPPMATSRPVAIALKAGAAATIILRLFLVVPPCIFRPVASVPALARVLLARLFATPKPLFKDRAIPRPLPFARESFLRLMVPSRVMPIVLALVALVVRPATRWAQAPALELIPNAFLFIDMVFTAEAYMELVRPVVPWSSRQFVILGVASVREFAFRVMLLMVAASAALFRVILLKSAIPVLLFKVRSLKLEVRASPFRVTDFVFRVPVHGLTVTEVHALAPLAATFVNDRKLTVMELILQVVVPPFVVKEPALRVLLPRQPSLVFALDLPMSQQWAVALVMPPLIPLTDRAMLQSRSLPTVLADASSIWLVVMRATAWARLSALSLSFMSIAFIGSVLVNPQAASAAAAELHALPTATEDAFMALLSPMVDLVFRVMSRPSLALLPIQVLSFRVRFPALPIPVLQFIVAFLVAPVLVAALMVAVRLVSSPVAQFRVILLVLASSSLRFMVMVLALEVAVPHFREVVLVFAVAVLQFRSMELSLLRALAASTDLTRTDPLPAVRVPPLTVIVPPQEMVERLTVTVPLPRVSVSRLTVMESILPVAESTFIVAFVRLSVVVLPFMVAFRAAVEVFMLTVADRAFAVLLPPQPLHAPIALLALAVSAPLKSVKRSFALEFASPMSRLQAWDLLPPHPRARAMSLLAEERAATEVPSRVRPMVLALRALVVMLSTRWATYPAELSLAILLTEKVFLADP